VTESGLPTLQTATETAAGIKSRKLASLQQSEEDARRADHDVTSLKLKLADVNGKLSTAERDLISKRASTEAALASPELSKFDDVAAALAHADEQLVRASRRLTSLQSMAKCYEQFIASAKADKSCVVCKRGLDNAELESFVKVNSERQRTTPEQVATAKSDQSKWQALVDRLRAAAPGAAALQELNKQVPALRASLEATEAELKAREASHADTMTKRRELQRQLEVVDGVVGDLARLEADAAETQRLRSELHNVSESAPGAGATDANGRPIPRDVLQRDFDAKSSDVQKLNAQLLDLQRRAAASAGSGSAVEAELSAKRKALSDAEASARHAAEVDARVAEMNSEMEQFNTRIEAIAERRKEHTKSLATAEERSAQVQKEHAERLRTAEAASREAEGSASKLHDSARAVREYLDGGSAEKTAAARRSLKATEDHVRQLDEQAKGLQSVVAKARGTLDDQHSQRQAITDGLSLHNLMAELEKERATVAHAERELAALSNERIAEVSAILGPELQGNSSLSALSNARERCRSKIGELERQRAQNRGALETLLRDVNDRRATLGQDKYREIDKRYSSTFIKAQTTELAIEDIDKYYRALEKAVSSYHAEKVSQINRIVSDLWRATYRGSDIDTIEIRSEDEGSTVTSARRSYRYRVVMKRGDAELDMRGRCSAGQKVLASVIIRMALSEAFCCDCGILALDEPTTNLDDDNARALAESLRDLIQARRAVSHFQLVVITHDEEFVKALGSNHRADSFYFVSKDREGSFSTIQERRFGDLFL
jgi:DNA repair protein RAD50